MPNAWLCGLPERSVGASDNDLLLTVDAQGQRNMITGQNPVIMFAYLEITPFNQIHRGENIINVVPLLLISLQKKCWFCLCSLHFFVNVVILALEPQRFQLSNNVRVIPPAVGLIPDRVAIEVAKDDRF